MSGSLLASDSDLRSDIEQLIKEAYEVRVKDLSQSISLANRALELSLGLNDLDLQAKIKNQLSLFHFILCDFELSLVYANEALAHFEKVKDLQGIALAKYNIGST